MANASGNQAIKGKGHVSVQKNAQVTVNRQGPAGGARNSAVQPFRQTLTNPSMGVDDIPQKARMFPQSFCPPPCPMPMCCPPPFCYPSFCCPPPMCMPRQPICPFPCNPCCPPCFTPPMPCCPPPMPCCPQPCCPPKKCCCKTGNKRIVCIPRGKTLMTNCCPSPCDPCCEKPASYNNCNFYVSECPQAEQCPCPGDTCSEGTGNAAAGDDRVFPPPRCDEPYAGDLSRIRGKSNYLRNSTDAGCQTPVSPPPPRPPPNKKPKTPPHTTRPATPAASSHDIEVKVSSNVNVSIEDDSQGSSNPKRSNEGNSSSNIHRADDVHGSSNTKRADNRHSSSNVTKRDADGHSSSNSKRPAGNAGKSSIHNSQPRVSINTKHQPPANRSDPNDALSIQAHASSSVLTAVTAPETASGKDSMTRLFTGSSKEPDDGTTDDGATTDRGETATTTITGGNSGTVIHITSDTTVRAVLNGGNSGTTIRDSPPTTTNDTFGFNGSRSSRNPGSMSGGSPPETGNGSDRSRQSYGGGGRTSEGGNGGPRKSVTQGSAPSPIPFQNGGKRIEVEADTSVNVRVSQNVPRSHSDPETTTKRRKHKKKKKKKRSKSIPQVCKPKKPKCFPPFRDTQIGGGAFERPVRTIYERECSNPCPWNDPCDYSYQPVDHCGHRDTLTINSPCGLCYRDYDVCTATVATFKWPPNTRHDSRSDSPEMSFTWRRDGVREVSRCSERGHKDHWRRGPRGLPMPSPSDTSTYDMVTSQYKIHKKPQRRHMNAVNSSISVDSVNPIKQPRPFRMHDLFDLNMNRSSTSKRMLGIKSTRSLVNISTSRMRSREGSFQRSKSLIRLRRRSQSLRRPSLSAIRFPDAAQRLVENNTEAEKQNTAETTVMLLQHELDELSEKCWKSRTEPPQQQRNINFVNLEPPENCSKNNFKKWAPSVLRKLRKLKNVGKKSQIKKDDARDRCCNASKLHPGCCVQENLVTQSLLNGSMATILENDASENKNKYLCAVVPPECCDKCTGPNPGSTAALAVDRETETNFDCCAAVPSAHAIVQEPASNKSLSKIASNKSIAKIASTKSLAKIASKQNSHEVLSVSSRTNNTLDDSSISGEVGSASIKSTGSIKVEAETLPAQNLPTANRAGGTVETILTVQTKVRTLPEQSKPKILPEATKLKMLPEAAKPISPRMTPPIPKERKTVLSKIPRPTSKPPPPKIPGSASSHSSVSSVSRPYSPGELLGATTTDTDGSAEPGSTVTLLPPKPCTPPVPKPRRLPPRRHECRDLSPPPPVYCTDTCIPLFPPLRDPCSLAGTNTYRPHGHFDDRNTSCRPRPRQECCQQGSGHLDTSDQPGFGPSGCLSSIIQFEPCRSFGFHPDLTRVDCAPPQRPDPACLDSMSRLQAHECAPAQYSLSVIGHRIYAIPSNNSVSVLPKIPSPRTKPKTIVAPSTKASNAAVSKIPEIKSRLPRLAR